MRQFFYENFLDVAEEGVTMAREANTEEADISAALLVEHLLAGAAVSVINQIGMTEFLLLAKDAYGRTIQDTKKAMEKRAKAEAEAPVEMETTQGPLPANVVPFSTPKKTLH